MNNVWLSEGYLTMGWTEGQDNASGEIPTNGMVLWHRGEADSFVVQTTHKQSQGMDRTIDRG